MVRAIKFLVVGLLLIALCCVVGAAENVSDPNVRLTFNTSEVIENPYDHLVIDASSAVDVTNTDYVELSKPDENGHYDYVNISGGTHETHIGRLTVTTTPTIDKGGIKVLGRSFFTEQVDMASTIPEITGKNSMVSIDSSGDVESNYTYYNSTIKENITLNNPVASVGYDYSLGIEDWTIYDHYTHSNYTTHGADYVADINLDKFGNLNITINDSEVVIIPKPWAIDADGNRYELYWELDKENNHINIIGLENLTDAVYPVVIDPTERLTNTGFAGGSSTGWSFGNHWTVSGGASHDGDGYIAYFYDPNGESGALTHDVNFNNIPRFSAWMRINSNYGAGCSLSIAKVNGNAAAATTSVSASYAQYNTNVNYDVNNHLLYISGTHCEALVDDIHALEDVPYVTATSGAATTNGAPVTFSWNSYGDATIGAFYYTDPAGTSHGYSSSGITGTYSGTYAINSFSYGSGLYTFIVATQNADGTSSLSYAYTTYTQSAPVAAFSGTPTTAIAPFTVTFTDSSTNSPTHWHWDYGDGTANMLTPMQSQMNIGTCDWRQVSAFEYGSALLTTSTNGDNFIYTATPTSVKPNTQYTMSAVFTGNTPADCRIIEYNGASYVGEYSASPTSGGDWTRITATFTTLANCDNVVLRLQQPNIGSNHYTNVQLEAGASATTFSWESVQNPTHIYYNAGTYTVTETASNDALQADNEIKSNYITVNAPSISSGASPANGGTVSNSQYSGTVTTAFSWTAISGCTDYWIVIDGTGHQIGSATPSYSLGLSPGSHTWYIQGFNGGTQCGSQSNTNTFTVAAYPGVPAPTPSYPTTGTTVNNSGTGAFPVNISWVPFTGLAIPTYQYTIKNAAGTVLKQDITNNNYAIYSLQPGIGYQWYVQIYDPNTGSYGTASATQTFTVSTPTWNGYVIGTVYNSAKGEGIVVPGATIIINNKFYNDAPHSNTSHADGNGFYCIKLENGSYDISAKAEGYESSMDFPITVNSTLPSVPLNIPLDPVKTYYVPPNMKLVVCAPWGTVYSGVTCTVYKGSDASTSPIYQNKTGYDGACVVPYDLGNQYYVTFIDPEQNINTGGSLSPTQNQIEYDFWVYWANKKRVSNSDFGINTTLTSTTWLDDVWMYQNPTTSYNTTYAYINQSINSTDSRMSGVHWTTVVTQVRTENGTATGYTNSISGVGNAVISLIVPSGYAYSVHTVMTYSGIADTIKDTLLNTAKPAIAIPLEGLGITTKYRYWLFDIVLWVMMILGCSFSQYLRDKAALATILLVAGEWRCGWLVEFDTGMYVMILVASIIAFATIIVRRQ